MFFMKRLWSMFLLIGVLTCCNDNKIKVDASGTFEAEEVIVSSQISGQLVYFPVNEGDLLQEGQTTGVVDSTQLSLQKQQVNATISSLNEKTVTVAPQVQLLQDQLQVQKTQLANLLHEKERTERLVKADAATGKQLDDINYQVEVAQKQIRVTEQQIAVQRSNAATQNRSVLSETNPLQKQAAQVQEQLSKSKIINPINGTVITKYAEQGEVTGAGKALYKIANLEYLNLRAYITESQLSLIKLHQQVKVLVDKGANAYRTYTGEINWISDKAEFTPKTIQTKEERANLVYAIKIRVKNDGFLKIGMYGEVQFENK
jgi:HlyD family secretion protein